MVSNGTITNYTPTGGGAFGHREPVTGDYDPPHIRFERRWLGCRSEHDRAMVEVEARAEFDGLRKRQAPLVGFVEVTLTEQVLEKPGFDAEQVAAKFGCLARQVRKIRQEHGFDGETGNGKAVLDQRFVKVHVLRLAAKGWGLREIERELGVPRATASDWVRRAA